MELSVMGNKKLLFISLFLLSCGKQVEISTKQLEYNSSLSNGASLAVNQEGTLVRGTPDRISTNGSSYKVSIYSSYIALEFIAAKPLSAQLPVKFRGKVKNNEMLLENIQAK